MIIANALKVVFNGKPISIKDNGVDRTTTVKFGYGDQKELIKWVENENKRPTTDKYPLIWYVLDEFTEFQGVYDTNVKLVLMTLTREEKFNEWRTANNYIGVLQPLYELVLETLQLNQYIELLGNLETLIKQYDEPNFGVSRAKGSFEVGQTESVSLDFVDAKILTFRMKIKVDCII